MRGGSSALLVRLRTLWAEVAGHRLVRALERYWRRDFGLAILATVSALLAAHLISLPGKAPDFTVFWAAARHAFSPVYDTDFLTPLQAAPPGPRPFAYPPTFLMMILPIGLIPFKAAFVTWVGLSVALFVACGLRQSRLAWLAVVSPTLMFVALIGQSTLLVGGLIVLGLSLAGARPLPAGLVLGVAACIKPQLLLLVPLALLLLRDGRAIASAAMTAAVLAFGTTLLFGPGIWGEWLGSVGEFLAINDRLGIKRLGLPWVPALVIPALFAAATLMWLAARDNDRPRLIAATIGASLLLSPHAAFYESAILLLPALAMTGLNWRLMPISYLLLGGATTTATLAATVVGLTIPIGWIPFSRFLGRHRFCEAPRA